VRGNHETLAMSLQCASCSACRCAIGRGEHVLRFTCFGGEIAMSFRDPIHDESFRRVVGARRPGPIGDPPLAAAREAMTKNASYPTGAPKGVFRYRTHEEANAHREAWTRDRVRSGQQANGSEAGPTSTP
jgi:hypothetical protein